MSSCSSRALTILSTVFGACGLLLVGVAVSTDYWLIMVEGIILQQNQSMEVKMALHSGLWRVCFVAGRRKYSCVHTHSYTHRWPAVCVCVCVDMKMPTNRQRWERLASGERKDGEPQICHKTWPIRVSKTEETCASSCIADLDPKSKTDIHHLFSFSFLFTGSENGRCVASEYFTEPEIEITTENTANILSEWKIVSWLWAQTGATGEKVFTNQQHNKNDFIQLLSYLSLTWCVRWRRGQECVLGVDRRSSAVGRGGGGHRVQDGLRRLHF